MELLVLSFNISSSTLLSRSLSAPGIPPGNAMTSQSSPLHSSMSLSATTCSNEAMTKHKGHLLFCSLSPVFVPETCPSVTLVLEITNPYKPCPKEWSCSKQSHSSYWHLLWYITIRVLRSFNIYSL